VEEGGIKGEEFFELDAFDAEVVEEEGEDSCVGLDCEELSIGGFRARFERGVAGMAFCATGVGNLQAWAGVK
jgi:hypothetical protein